MASSDRPTSPRAPGSAAAKEALRVRLRRARSLRSDAAGAAIARHGSTLAQGHACVALYASTGTEPDTWSLIDELVARRVRVLLPVLAGRREPDWAAYGGRDALRAGWHGIAEPIGPPLGAEGLGEASLIVASALALTARGERLGAGGGWYDRALAHRRRGALVAGLCFAAEVLDEVPTAPWDRRVDVVLTEVGAAPAQPGRDPE